MSDIEKPTAPAPIMVRVNAEELRTLQTKAADASLPVSTFLRKSGLSQKIHGKTTMHLIQELRLLGIQQKELCTAHGGALTPEYRAVLIEILAAVGRIGV